MKYLVSFRTTLRISRYLFRGLALLVWLVGALLTAFYLFNILHQKENVIREQLFNDYSQAQWRASHLAESLRGLKYISENQLNRDKQPPEQPTLTPPVEAPPLPPLAKNLTITPGGVI